MKVELTETIWDWAVDLERSRSSCFEEFSRSELEEIVLQGLDWLRDRRREDEEAAYRPVELAARYCARCEDVEGKPIMRIWYDSHSGLAQVGIVIWRTEGRRSEFRFNYDFATGVYHPIYEHEEVGDNIMEELQKL